MKTGSTGMFGPVACTGSLSGVSGLSSATGMPGMTGATGMTSSNLRICERCHQSSSNMIIVDITLNTLPTNTTDIKVYYICRLCRYFTRKEIHELSTLPLIKLPLHINNENVFVRHYVAERLKQG